jgi:N-acetylglutamate synthase-like GNAT family acetyltransferase
MKADYGPKVARGQVSVADEAGGIVGLIVLIREPDHLLVENVAVAPERQGEGIGRALLVSPRSWLAKRISRPFVSTPMPP